MSHRLILLSALLASLAMPGQAQHDYLLNPASSDLDEYGGARRTAGDVSTIYGDLAAANASAPVRNVILMIGDGMGDSEITIARNYVHGAGGAFPGIDALPVTGQYTHYSLDRETGLPNYVTDSAASATSFASGIKTYNGAIGVDLRGQPHASIMTLASKAGMATGNVTTAAIQDATPAAQYAHISQRSCAGPEETAKRCADYALESGGPGSITEQLLGSPPRVTFGGGAAIFQQRAKAGEWQGRTLLDQARDRGFTIVNSVDALDSLAPATAQSGPVLGLFAGGNMPVRWMGPKARLHGNLELPPVTCESNPERTSDIPGLAQMTAKAIELLSGSSNGFFLQVEGASIDKQAHAANPCGQIGETVDLDEAVQVALDFARRDGETLVIVTADHAHAGQIIANGSSSPGMTLSLLTKDNAVMTVNYANDERGGSAHTGSQLRVAAFGPRAFNVSGLLDQTDIHFIIRDVLDLTARDRSPANEHGKPLRIGRATYSFPLTHTP